MVTHSTNTKLLPQAERETTVFVKASTPYVSALKRLDRILEKFDTVGVHHHKYQRGEYKKIKYVTVKGMGRAIDKTLSVALHYQGKQHKVDVYTGTVEVVDEVKASASYATKDESDEETDLRGRSVGYVEAKVWLKRK